MFQLMLSNAVQSQGLFSFLASYTVLPARGVGGSQGAEEGQNQNS